MQQLTIAGNVGNVQPVREVGSDKVLNFSIAVDNGKDKNGEKRDPLWVRCSLWGKRAESLAPYIAKGSKLAVSGRPGVSVYEGKGSLELTVSELTFMSSKSDGERSESRDRDDDTRGGSAGYSQSGVQSQAYPDDSDIPF